MTLRSDYFPVHAHSQFSGMDGMDTVDTMVERVVELGQPAMALTDHGNLAGVVQGYKACRKADIGFYAGSEFYMVTDIHDDSTKGTRYHLGMLALDQIGYETLVKLSSLSWTSEHFYYKPLICLSDLAELHEAGLTKHLAVTTGCYSSLVMQSLVNNNKSVARRVVQMLAHWFPNLYVELQDHGIVWPDGKSDADHVLALYDIAGKLGLPVVFGGDSHYILPDEQPVHDLMKDICYFGAGEDIHFNGGPYHLLSAKEVKKRLPKHIWQAVDAGHADLLDKHALKIAPLDNYQFMVPSMFKKADTKLRKLAYAGLTALGLTDPGYVERLDRELDVIIKMGMPNYFLLVKTHITDWCREHDIIINTRGSANGSLLCYAIGITTVDPLKWRTSFDRFLSLDRMKPPDIDVDVDFQGRTRLIDHLRVVFPSMTQVGTWALIGFGKPDPDTGEERGSVIVQYMAAMGKKDPFFQRKVKPEHRQALNALANTPVYKSMGTGAAGFILPGDDHPIERYLPMARIISSNNHVTQMNKDDVEALGYLKVDILGLRALQTLNGTLTRIGRKANDWSWIPDDDPQTCAMLRKGQSVGVFQYEGWTNRKGAMEMKIKSTMDCIIGVALYRPALINGGQKDLFLDNRGKAKANQQRLHGLFDPIVADTSGVPLYQEQIMEILKTIGMEFREYNELMTAIKASNGFIQNAAQTFQRLQPLFYRLCADRGLDDADTDQVWNAVVGFTEYGFNRAHSTSYGLMAYYAAYLKTHHPFEFMVSLLNVWVGVKDKEPGYITEARRLGYSIVRPDVNVSQVSWDVDPTRSKALRKGLLTIKGVGENAALAIVANRPDGGYTSIQDFIDRNPGSPVTGGKDWSRDQTLIGVCKALYDVNAFRSVGNQ